MNHRRLHWFEKFQVQLVTLALLGGSYFLLWPLVRGEPLEPLSFLAVGGILRGVWFACILLLGAAACAAATIHGRIEGSLLALLLGLGGLSARSPQIRSLLWSRLGNTRGTYFLLIFETVLLLALLATAWGVVLLVRRALLAKRGERSAQASRPLWLRLAGAEAARSVKDRDGEPEAPASPTPAQVARFLLIEAVVGTALVLLIAKSPDRGQLLFALLAAWTLGTLVAHQHAALPIPAPACGVPMVAGVALYAVAAVQADTGDAGPQAWIYVDDFARALPVDWLTAGGGGAALGVWISSRMHHAKRIERIEKMKQEGART